MAPRRIWIIIGAVVFVVVATLSILVWNQRRLGVEGIGEGLDGYFWLSLGDEQRQFWLWGFLRGYWLGYTNACSTAGTISQPRWNGKLSATCHHAMPEYSRPLQHYAQRMTEFYNRYPSDRHVPVFVLREQLSAQKSISLDEIHILVSSRTPIATGPQ